MTKECVLETFNVNKSFFGVKVLDSVSFGVRSGEVHALMGENGAGKSTLMRIIMGIYKADSGEIRFEGKPVVIREAGDALHLGISMIHQELNPIPEMTVAENVFLGREPHIGRLPIVDFRQLNKDTQALLEQYEMADRISPEMHMSQLSIAQMQMMEIIKAVSYNSKVIIIDEPTSSLSEDETQQLFKTIDLLRNSGVGIIYISHRMAEVFELGDIVKIDMQDAEGDINKQLEQAETMLAKGVDAVILNAVDVDGSAPVVDMFMEAGIPCIECNTLTNNSADATCYVGSDDVDAGKIQAEYLLGVLPNDGKVCYMMGPIGVSPQIYRLEGITKYLFDVTDIEVLQSQTANWKRDEAMSLAENWLTQYQDLCAIICQNDDMAMGALEAAEAMDRKEGLVIVGIDAITDAVQAVKDGRLDATVFQDAAGQGAGAVDVALKCAQEGLIKTDDVWIPFLPVTIENVADFE